MTGCNGDRSAMDDTQTTPPETCSLYNDLQKQSWKLSHRFKSSLENRVSYYRNTHHERGWFCIEKVETRAWSRHKAECSMLVFCGDFLLGWIAGFRQSAIGCMPWSGGPSADAITQPPIRRPNSGPPIGFPGSPQVDERCSFSSRWTSQDSHPTCLVWQDGRWINRWMDEWIYGCSEVLEKSIWPHMDGHSEFHPNLK